MEWLSELFGFLILLLIFVFPLIRKLLLDKKKIEQTPEIEEELEPEEEEFPAPQSSKSYYRPATTDRLVKKDFEFRTRFEQREYDSQIEEHQLETHVDPQFKQRIVSESFILDKKKKKQKKQLIDAIIKKHDSGKSMVILSEIFGKPKSFL